MFYVPALILAAAGARPERSLPTLQRIHPLRLPLLLFVCHLYGSN
jgi:hypothetical protein